MTSNRNYYLIRMIVTIINKKNKDVKGLTLFFRKNEKDVDFLASLLSN